MSDFDPRELRQAFGTFLTGVTVVTTNSHDNVPVGFTANSFSSVSMEPPLILVCPAKSLGSFKLFEACDHFAVSILNESQRDVSNTFASSGEDRFSKINWSSDQFGSPIITGANTTFSCSFFNSMDAGDHIILVGKVESFSTTGESGLGYSPNGYFSLTLEREAEAQSSGTHAATVGAIIEFEEKVLLCDTGKGYQPLSMSAKQRGSLATVRKHLSNAGLTADIGPVYSIYDHSETAEVITWYRGHTRDSNTHGLGEYIPIQQLKSLRYSNEAVKTMMHRYATERANGVFGLYVGDESTGDVHLFGEGAI